MRSCWWSLASFALDPRLVEFVLSARSGSPEAPEYLLDASRQLSRRVDQMIDGIECSRETVFFQ